MTEEQKDEINAINAPKWEYNWLVNPDDEHMMRMGNNGWEAYAVTEAGDSFTVFFKRPL